MSGGSQSVPRFVSILEDLNFTLYRYDVISRMPMSETQRALLRSVESRLEALNAQIVSLQSLLPSSGAALQELADW